MVIIERFRDLPTGQKIGAVAFALVGAYLIIYLIASAFLTTEEDVEEETTYTPPSVSSSASPSEAPDGSDEPKEEEDNRPNVEGSSIPKVSGNKLSVSEQRKATEVADKGVEEFTNWEVGEKISEREKRFSKYFEPKSPTLKMDPELDRKAKDYLTEKGNVVYASYATVNSVNIVGGDDKVFRINVGVELRSQTLDDKGKAISSVKSSNPLYTVDLAKAGKSWKIKYLTKD